MGYETIRDRRRVPTSLVLICLGNVARGRRDDHDTNLHSRLGNPWHDRRYDLATRRGTQG